jgi:hypothetical protein
MSIPRDNYVGEPNYPAPWTTKQPLEGLRDVDEARIVSLSPDVCLTPVGSSVVPIPYPVVDYCGHDRNYTPSVRFTGEKAMVMRSCTTHVHGDAPGTRKGVKSGTVESICEPIGHADQVRAEGSNVIRHLDRFWMNNKNTQGEAIFVRGTETHVAPVDDDPVQGSLRRISGSDEGRVVSDAMPEPLIMGAQYAQALPQQTPTPSVNPSPAPRPITVNPVPPAANDNILERRGTFARPQTGAAARLLVLLGMAEAGHAMGDMAGRWYVGPDGVMGKAIGEKIGTGQVNPFSQQGQVIGEYLGFPSFGSDANIKYANDLLSLKSGVPQDFRTMDPEDLEDLIKAPWPRAEQLRENAKRLQQKALPQSKTVRITERDEYRKQCQVDSYKVMAPICRQYGMQAHHIVPDWTLRYGTREEGVVGINRIKNMPGFWEGQSICVIGQARVSGSEHNQGHAADDAIESLGKNSTPPYTTRLENVKRESIKAMVKVRPDCARQILEAVNREFMGTNANQLVRAKQYPPLPQPTLDALSSGAISGANSKQ